MIVDKIRSPVDKRSVQLSESNIRLGRTGVFFRGSVGVESCAHNYPFLKVTSDLRIEPAETMAFTPRHNFDSFPGVCGYFRFSQVQLVCNDYLQCSLDVFISQEISGGSELVNSKSSIIRGE